MATEASSATDFATGSSTAATATSQHLSGDERPYGPSWVNLLINWIERLPGPTWLAYIAIAAISVVLSLLGPSGLQSNSDPVYLAGQAFWAVFLPLTLWLMGYLADIAGTALDTFRPVLAATDAEVARLRYVLTVAPARPAAALLLFTAITTPIYYLADPVGSQVVGLSPLGMLFRYVSEVFFGSLILVLVLHSFRQLREVGRTHSRATRVDLFRPAPLYAFSILTSRTAIVIALVFILPTFLTLGLLSTSLGAVFFFLYLGGGIVAAMAVFVLPLRGMQKRIIAEKRRLQGEVGLRVEATIAAIHAAVDRGDMTAAAGMHDALGVLVMERDLVDRLPTLPWRPGTLGALVSAIVLPIGLFLLQRALSQFI